MTPTIGKQEELRGDGEPGRSAGLRARVRSWAEPSAWAATAAVAFHAGYWVLPGLGMVIYLFALVQLIRTARGRGAYYTGLAVGLLIAVGRLTFFWTIFSGGAMALWYVYAFWLGLFVAIAEACRRRLGDRAWWLVPFLWTGFEYFRSELYYLRFSWLNVGYAFAEVSGHPPLRWLGMYGTGFFLMAFACLAAWCWPKRKFWALSALGVGAVVVSAGSFGQTSPPPANDRGVRVTGIQMEAPAEQEVMVRLEEAVRKYPETDLFVLSEYTFPGRVPEKIQSWCRRHRTFLVAGGKEPAPANNFYNMCDVVGPDGEVVFRQVKSVPIQFFRDGLPAPRQEVWASPWGKIGFCICYDLSYRRVTDRLVRLGAEALLVPTMDVLDWGRRQHELHARVAPVRAAEYGIPIFRLASSGISQAVASDGQVMASAPCPGDGAILRATLPLRAAGQVPWDGWLAPGCVGVTAGALGWLAWSVLCRKLRRGGPRA